MIPQTKFGDTWAKRTFWIAWCCHGKMSLVRQVLLTAALVATLASCGTGPAAKGTLTGYATGCGPSFPVTLDIYSSLYAGEWRAALQRVESLGENSGEPVVARTEIPSGATYRFKLAPGRYVASVGQDAHFVTVPSGHVTRLDFPPACFAPTGTEAARGADITQTRAA